MGVTGHSPRSLIWYSPAIVFIVKEVARGEAIFYALSAKTKLGLLPRLIVIAVVSPLIYRTIFLQKILNVRCAGKIRSLLTEPGLLDPTIRL